MPFPSLWMSFWEVAFKKVKKKKDLGVTNDKNLQFEEHILKQWKKVGQKLSALARVCDILNQEKRITLITTFLESQFLYCPLIWMFPGRNLNNRINHLHERSLRIVQNDYESSFLKLLELDNVISIYHRNICFLAIEFFKIKNGLSNQIMSQLFDLWKIEYNLRSQRDFFSKAVYAIRYGLHLLRYFAPKIWYMILAYIRNVSNLSDFPFKIKPWIPGGCPCNLCRAYICKAGYINWSLGLIILIFRFFFKNLVFLLIW